MPHRINVTQRSDGRYVATVQVAGVRKYVYGATPADVRARVAELDQQVTSAGRLPTPGRRTVADLLTAWLDAIGPTVRPKTMADYEGTVRRHLVPGIGLVRLARLDASHLQRVYARLAGAGHHRTAHRAHLIMGQACRIAVRWGWLAHNPADRALPPSYRPVRRGVWDTRQLGVFLEATTDHRFGPLWAVLVATGMRLGEALALTWSDVDLSAGTLTVRRTISRVGGQWVRGEPKTGAGRRAVVLPSDALAALRHQRAHVAEARLRAGSAWNDEGLVFPNLAGGPIHANKIENELAEACKRYGLPPLTPHGLRHLHASLLLAGGVPVPDVSRRLGHASSAITLAIYSHALPGRDQLAAEAYERAVGRTLASV